MKWLLTTISLLLSSILVAADPPTGVNGNLLITIQGGLVSLGYVTTSFTGGGAFLVDTTSSRLCTHFNDGRVNISGALPVRSYHLVGLVGTDQTWDSPLDAGYIGITPANGVNPNWAPPAYPGLSGRYFDGNWLSWTTDVLGRATANLKRYGGAYSGTLVATQASGFSNWRLTAVRNATAYLASGPDCTAAGSQCYSVDMHFETSTCS